LIDLGLILNIWKTGCTKNILLPNLKNYTGYIKNHTMTNRASGGVVTYIKNNIYSEEVIIQTHLETVVTLVELDKQLCICNIYISNSTPLMISDFKNIIDQLPEP